MLSCISTCWTWAHLPHTGTPYSVTEYTRAIADVWNSGAGTPQSVPATLLIMLHRAHSPYVFCTSAIDQELHRGTLVQSRGQALLLLVSLSVFWQPVCCPGECRSPLSSLRLGAASSSQSTRSGVRYQETVCSQYVKMYLIVLEGSSHQHIKTWYAW